MRKLVYSFMLLFSSLLLVSKGFAQSSPTISYTTPVNGPVGTSVKIVGSNFGASQGSSTVTFNGTPATPTSWSNTQVVAPVPTGATTGPVIVTVGGVASNKVNFTVGTPPTISYTNPVNGPVGTSVTIVGTYFGATQGSSTVTFNGTAATPTSWSNTQVVAPVPNGATTGPVVMTVGGVASNKVNFTVGTPPTISYTNPVNGPIGTSVTIVGNYFGASQGSSTVTFNGTAATPTSWSNTQVVAPVPSGATTGPVVVTVGGVASNKVNFTVGTPPTISYTLPVDGPIGTSVSIAGNYFGSSQGSSTITFNGIAATPTSWSNTQIVVPVPSGASTGPVVINVGGMASNGVNFIVGTPPTISYTNPVDGPVGTSVSIVGNYFGATQGSSTVTFNGVAATPTSWSNAQIVVPVPSGASTGPLVINVGGMASNSVNFIVGTPPTISYTNPVNAPVGNSIMVVGNYFGSAQGSSTITFNGIAGAPTSWSNTQIVVPVPSGASTGPLIVTVGGMASHSVNFTVLPTPSITSLSASSGSVGSALTITGTNFGATQGTSTVTFNGVAGTPTSWSSTQIVVPVPNGASTGNVVVTVNGVASSGAAFTVLPTPAITGLSPASAPAGVSVTISGTNFGTTQGASTVTFNGTIATPTSWSAGSIVVPVPAGATTGSVVVTVGGVSSVGSSFTVPTLVSLSLSPAVASISVGQTLQFTLTGTYSEGTKLSIGSTGTWTSSSPGVATVDNSGVATAAAVGQTTIQAAVGSLNASATLGVSRFVLTGSLNTGRNGSTVTVLDSGKVLVAGGNDSLLNSLASAELYDPAAGTFTATGSLNVARSDHTATLLNNGQVLLVGGSDSSGLDLGSSELYDPASGTFSLAGNLSTSRYFHSATMLKNGQVLIAGGVQQSVGCLVSAELYDPSSGTFTPAGNLNVARSFQTATMLDNGMVLLAGGADCSSNALSSAELYDPTSGTFTLTANLINPRWGHSGTLLNNGSVLMAGGDDVSDNPLASAELYSPSAGTFTLTGSLTTARLNASGTLLNNGTVLVAGGANCCVNDSFSGVYSSAELYDPTTGAFIATSNLNVAQYWQSGTLLPNGTVLIVGGNDTNGNVLASAELYQPSTLTPAGLVSISVTPQNPTITLGGVQPFVATGTLSDNSTQTLVSMTWASSNMAVATVSNDVANSGNASAVGAGVSTISACAGSICGSTPLTIMLPAPPPPSITSLSPTRGSLGAPVTILGANFGTSQGTSSVTFNGVAATPTSWNSTAIVVPVPAGATTGNVVVQVAGATSNAVSFTLVAPPSITATVTPPPNANGWNVPAVLVIFTCRAGGFPVANCSPPQTVSSEGPNQTVVGTVTDTSGGIATATVSLNIEQTPPTLIVVSPSDQSIFTSALATITGTVTNSLTPLVGVACNGATASFSGGTFSCNISLVPGVNLVMVTATDAAGNMAGARLHAIYSAALPAPSSLQITPANAKVLVGATQQFTAVDQVGRPRTDATWSVDNTSIATISTDSSPILTGAAIGVVTLTASVGSVSAQTQVNVLGGTSLPIGTALWSGPTVPGFSCGQVIQAVPSVSPAPSYYCTGTDTNNNLVVQALTGDGRQLWVQSSVSPNQAFATLATPDGFGGLLLDFFDASNAFQRVALDAQTGSVVWKYSSVSSPYQFAAIRPDNKIVSVLMPPSGPVGQSLGGGTLTVLDGQTGQQTLNVPLPPITLTVSAPSYCSYYDSQGSSPGVQPSPIVDSDGTSYLPFVSGTRNIFITNCDPNQQQETDNLTLYLAKVSADNSSFSFQSVQSADYPIDAGPIIPDGQGGFLVLSFNANLSSAPMQVTHVSSQGNSTYQLPLQVQNFQSMAMVLGDNGTAFATDGKTVAAFDQIAGSVYWTYQSAPQATLSIESSVAGSGIVVKSTYQNLDTPLYFAGTGTPTIGTFSGQQLAHTYESHWTNLMSGTLSDIAGWAIASPNSPWTTENQKGTNSATRKIRLTVLKVAEANIPDSFVQARVKTATDYWTEQGLLFDWNNTPISIPACDPSLTGCNSTSDQYLASVRTDAEVKEVYRRFIYDPNANNGQGRLSLSPRGITVLFVHLLYCQGASGSGTSAYTLPNTLPPSVGPFRGYNLNFVLAASDGCEIGTSSDDVLDHEFGHVLQLQHDGTSLADLLDFLFEPGLPSAEVNPSADLMCGPTGQDDWASRYLINECFPSRLTRYLTEQEQRSAVAFGNAVLAQPSQ
ncbi:MAG TPA: IPT/TIG domain-containing protein [Candidatus Limnocylindrales bacterium]|nr:IPT/TIG domain-containing protein [Candidatus Limnocylindrales bacterium]